MLSGGGRGRVLVLLMMKVHEGEVGVVSREVDRSLSMVLVLLKQETAFSVLPSCCDGYRPKANSLVSRSW